MSQDGMPGEESPSLVYNTSGFERLEELLIIKTIESEDSCQVSMMQWTKIKGEED